MIRLLITYLLICVATYFIIRFFWRRKKSLKHNIKTYEKLQDRFPDLIGGIIRLEEIKYRMDSDIQGGIESILQSQRNILDFYKDNPENFLDNSRRLLKNYTDSLVEILNKYIALLSRSNNEMELEKNKVKILELLSSMQNMVNTIEEKVLDNQFFALDIQIQSMREGLDLDK